ncbi:hypothetical protein [Rhodococcus sp. IEGM 1318]|uniref:hypothetical protein n=1 Tax=Rhodococcus sp. IEGM 1318 TaxID=3082226 RepID=UPI00295528C0|nr:hypothetical protein [Rhodococcus sp. IEGM 1318]MDV8007630.1 hypothetical protein [Rhodococcus sp. IEGM 1318]
MSKKVSAGLAVGVMVLVAGLIWTGFPLDAYSIVAVIFAICGGFITWIYLRENVVGIPNTEMKEGSR